MFAASGWPKMPKTPHSSLNLSMVICAGSRFRRQIRCSIAVDQTRSASSTDTSIDDLTVDGDPQPVAAGLADHPRRHARRRRPLRAPPCTSSGDADTTTRDADSPNSAAASFEPACCADVDAVDRHLGADAAGVEAALGQRHGQAAVRAVVRRPHQPLVGQLDEQILQRALARRDRAPAARRAPDRARASRYSLPPSSPRPSPSSTIDVAGRLEAPRRRRGRRARAGRRRRSPASDRSPCRRSRCRG